mmetsp:Transcript_5152/g.7972  ORF Transcript_5152/g.7972 Transcript_5152/m.7972 type:complete len:416 (+) Transcript_5152:173-1420(+)|eukprot:CAMPEP_0184658230 /NCGR_PEP_ID=MMETSP0308-20130426/24348_1 /TAXON_ID=38269 /ORGANISM="Gloeochaete witrockiana, Strain SAG 46.84" /LENGTH=415 /DNA_ID=CAMNT_0027097037 /DNA_START=68 /DNA_END=1315 /DNA_ORIENTATION=+
MAAFVTAAVCIGQSPAISSGDGVKKCFKHEARLRPEKSVPSGFSQSLFVGKKVSSFMSSKTDSQRAFEPIVIRADATEGRKLKVGLIGAGRIGQVHGETIMYRVPEAELAILADPFGDAAANLSKKIGVKGIKDYKEILADKSIEAVLICSPSDTHATLIKEAALAGKHIFCEKPISLDLKIIDECLEAVEKSGVKFFLAFQRRFDPNFKRLHDAVVNGEVGDVIHVHTTSRDPNPPPIAYVKQSGGIFMDMAIHDFDMLRYLTLSDPVEVFAKASVRIDPAIGEAGDYDTAMTMVKFANGAVGTVDNCRKATYGYDQRAEVFGSKAAININNNTANNMSVWGADGIKGQKPLDFFMDRYIDAYQAEVKAFVDSVVNDTPVATTGLDGRMAALTALAAKKSVAENRPVAISEVDV